MIEATARASSIGLLLDCAHSWEGQHLLNLRKPSSGRAWLGTSLHKSTAVFDRSRAQRQGITRDEAAGVFMDSLHKPADDVIWNDISQKHAAHIGLRLHHAYCTEWSPRYNFAHVEMTLEPLAVALGDGVQLTLTGSMDRARVETDERGAGLGIVDLKSGKNAVTSEGKADPKGHAAQLGVYELLAEHTLAVPVTKPARIIGLKTADTPKPMIGEAPVIGAKQQVIGTIEEPGLLQMVGQYFKTGLFPPNPRARICSEQYCVRWETCRFRPR